MLKYLIVSLSLTLVEGCASRAIKPLPIVNIGGVEIRDPTTLIVQLKPVADMENYNIHGFKVKLWTDELQEYTRHATENEEDFEYKYWRTIDKPLRELPTQKPVFEARLPAGNTTARFDDLELGVLYELRAQAFDDKEDGPLSRGFGFIIGPGEKEYPSTKRKLPSWKEGNVKVVVFHDDLDLFESLANKTDSET